MNTAFYLYHNKFQELAAKAIDCFTSSWGLEGVEKDIAIFKRKAYMKEALKYLKKSNQVLKGINEAATV